MGFILSILICYRILEYRLESCKELGIKDTISEQLMLCVDGASDTVPMKLEDPKQLVSFAFQLIEI